MKLEVKPFKKTANTTISKLYVDGVYECDLLEDAIRATKIKHETCIPAGTYKIGWHDSPRFGRVLPHLLQVPGYDYVLIHPGNSKDDTSGCLLPGRADKTDWISHSRVEFNELLIKLQAATARKEIITINITR